MEQDLYNIDLQILSNLKAELADCEDIKWAIKIQEQIIELASLLNS
jgi:hypothetical protein